MSGLTRREFSKAALGLAGLAVAGPIAALEVEEPNRLPAPEDTFTFHNLDPVEQFLAPGLGGPDLHELWYGEARWGGTEGAIATVEYTPSPALGEPWGGVSCLWERARREWFFRERPNVRYRATWAIRKIPREVECDRRLMLARREFTDAEMPGTGGGIEAVPLEAKFVDAGDHWIAEVDNLTLRCAERGFRYPVWLYERGRTA